MSTRGQLRITYTAKGSPRFELDVRHEELNKYQLVRGDNQYVVEQKARAVMAQWDEMWAKKKEALNRQAERQLRAQAVEEKKALAVGRTEDAQNALTALESILAHTLSVDDTIDWESLKDYSRYPVPKPIQPMPPRMPDPPEVPRKPQRSDAAYEVQLTSLDKLISSRRVKKENEAKARFKRDYKQWHETLELLNAQHATALQEYEKKVSELKAEYESALSAWEAGQAAYLAERDQRNAAVDEKRQKYLGGDAAAVIDYCDMVLSRSEYPDYFPQSYDLDYNPESRLLMLDYQLPPVSVIPTLKEVRYVQSRDDFTETHISQSQLNSLYDSILYQVVLRTIHELFEADKIDALSAIALNGYVRSVDPATGREVNPCVLSVLASKEAFQEINLADVDPKACFKKLKGVGSSKLHSMAAVAPILKMEREDKRFTTSYEVAASIQEGDNLAAMDWVDFEHLVRELFEKEFSVSGGEVKVTQASRDGGVDAVVFDPDPLRGGKIIIQAKRYTNPVGVSVVRELYGTVVNEGANKGILVTTSDYGPDAYEFAKDKPLVLLNGSNLLHLLEKHGHKARIDLREAKRALADNTES